MKFIPRFDRIIIDSPFPPLERGLSDLKLRQFSPNQAKRHLSKFPIIFTKRAYGPEFFIRYAPIIQPFTQTKIQARLSIKAGNMSPKDIERIALMLFGSLQGLRISYVETRVDFLDLSFQTVSAHLAVIGKRKINYKFSGQTLYFGTASSRHQIVLYDKGLEQKSQSNTHIRVEARQRYSKNDRPLLQGFLTGIWRPKNPFRKTYFVDTNGLSLKREDKISIGKIGLSRFYMGLNHNRRKTLLKHIENSIQIDFNLVFAEWSDTWVDPSIQAKNTAIDDKTETELVRPMGNLCYGLLRVKRAFQYLFKNKDNNLSFPTGYQWSFSQNNSS